MGGRHAGVRSEAILLKRTDFGDADRVVSVLTKERGRVSLLARSARSSRKRFGAALEPFQIIEVAFGDGRGELGTLREARVLRAFPRLASDLSAMTIAGSCVERLRAILPENHPEPRALQALAELYELLDDAPVAGASAGLRFELRTLAVLGHAPLLSGCVSCGRPLAAGRTALFSGVRGGVVCQACGGGPLSLSGTTVAAMRASMEAGWAGVEMSSSAALEAGEALSTFVSHHMRPRRASQVTE